MSRNQRDPHVSGTPARSRTTRPWRTRARRAGIAAAAGLPALALVAVAPANAAEEVPLIHNVTLQSSEIFCIDRTDGTPNHGGDMAFFGSRMVLACGADDSNLQNDGFVVLDITDPVPQLLGRFDCVASASDIALWGDLVFLAVDANNDTTVSGLQVDELGVPRPLYHGPKRAVAPPPGRPDAPPYEWDTCDAGVVPDDGEGAVFKGLRIVSIADPQSPELLASIALPGQPGRHPLGPEIDDRTVAVHNITLRPLRAPSGDVDTVRLYLNDPDGSLNHAVDVPVDDPTSFDLDNQWRPEPGPTNTGCHDLAVFEPAGVGACSRLADGTAIIDLDTGQSLGDIVGPRRPAAVAPDNRDLQRHHSGAFSYDGSTLFLSDEPLQSLALGRCPRDPDPHYGSLWAFTTVADSNGKLGYRGRVRPPRVDDTGFCTSKQFNVVPMDDGRDVLVVAWTGGGTSVLEWHGDRNEFTTLAQYVDRTDRDREKWSGTWASHWYNGRVYVNNAHGCFFGPQTCVGPKKRGLDVLTLDDSLGITEHAVDLEQYGFAMQECFRVEPVADATAARCGPQPKGPGREATAKAVSGG